MQRSIFIGIFILIFLLLDWYLFSGIKQLSRNWSINSQRILNYSYWSIPIISILVFLLGFYWLNERLNFRTRNFLASFILIIYVSKIFAVFVLLIGDLIKIARISFQWIGNLFSDTNSLTETAIESTKITRSDFLTQSALAIGVTHIAAMSWGIISGAHDYRIRKVELKLPNLPKAFDGLKLIQISDIHSGSFYNKTAVQGGIDMLMNEKPDLVFFTGDLVNNKADELSEDYFDIFKQVKAPLGVYSTLGNHDYGDYTQWKDNVSKIQNLDNLKEAHRLMGWNLLQDENKKLTIDNESIGILGIQNWGAGFAQYGNLEKALEHSDEFETKLLLSHDPSHWREQVLNKTTIDASFAGHTHGMQYGVEIGDFKWSPVQFRYKEWAGLYQEKQQQLYVNRGYGFIGYPGRLGILPEITVFELKKG